MISIRPKYLSQFKCDGRSCKSRCCKGWKVAVDGAAYSKYCSIANRDIRQVILSEIERTDDQKRFIKMKSDQRCAFLDDDYLCKIQKHCGEEYLTAICHSYPRVSYKLGDVLEQSLTLTCPVAARLILLPTSSIEFEEVEVEKPRGIFDWTSKLSIPIEEAVSIQATAISILQDRHFDFNERLMKLCMFLRDDKDDISSIFNLENHAETMINIFSEMYEVKLTEEKAANLQNIWTKYHKIILQRLMDNYAHIFENYLVNEFFMRCYPFAFEGSLIGSACQLRSTDQYNEGNRHSLSKNLWKNCKAFITSYKFVEFSLVLAAISKNGFVTVEEFLTMIDAVNEKLDHSRGGMKAILNFASD